MCVYIKFCIHSSVDGHLGCLRVLTVVNSAAGTLGMHVSFWIEFSSDTCPSVIAGSYGNHLKCCVGCGFVIATLIGFYHEWVLHKNKLKMDKRP